MAGGAPKAPSREGPFTILSGMAGVAAIVVAAVALLLPTARLVAGGALVGIAIGVVGTWAVGLRAKSRGAQPRLPVVVPLVTAACGLFLLLAPTFLALPQPSGASAVNPAQAPSATHVPTPAVSVTAGADTPSPSPSVSGSTAVQASPSLPDQYLADLTSDRNAKTGQLSGPGYQFAHGFGKVWRTPRIDAVFHGHQHRAPVGMRLHSDHGRRPGGRREIQFLP